MLLPKDIFVKKGEWELKNKISNKIVLCVVLCSVLISAVVGITAIKGSTIAIKEEAYKEVSSIAASRGNEYSIEIQKTENTVKEYAQIISDGIDTSKISDEEYMNTFERQFASLTNSIGVSNKGIVGLYINFNPELTGGKQPYDLAYFYDEHTNDRGIYYNSYKMDQFHEDNEELSWYYNPIKEKGGVWSKPYIDPDSNNIKMISYTMPVYKEDKLIGVAGLDISFENLQKMILDTSLYSTGSAFLLDKDYTFIVDKNKTSEDNLSTMENGKYNYFVEDIKNKKESVIEMNFEGVETVMGYYTLNNGQIIGVRVPTDEVLKDMNRLISIMVIVISIGLIISSILGAYISRKISTPIETATDFMQKLAELDLTEMGQNFDSMISNKDETGLMIKSLVNQREVLVRFVKLLKNNSLQILQDTEIISNAENETVESIIMISNVMEQLLESAGEQAREVRKGSLKLNTLASDIEEIASSLSNLEGNSTEMKKMREQVKEGLRLLGEELKRNVQDTSNADNTLGELMIKSNQAEEFIADLSSQIESLVMNINKLNKDKEDVLVSIQEVSLLTEDVAVSVENVTASIAEQEVAMKSTSERTTELKKVSEELDRIVGKFKI